MKVKIIYKDYDFRHFCDDYEYQHPESYKNDIEFLNIKNYLGKEEEVSIEPSLLWLPDLKKIILSAPNKNDICIDCSTSSFGQYVAEQVDNLIHFKI